MSITTTTTKPPRKYRTHTSNAGNNSDSSTGHLKRHDMIKRVFYFMVSLQIGMVLLYVDFSTTKNKKDRRQEELRLHSLSTVSTPSIQDDYISFLLSPKSRQISKTKLLMEDGDDDDDDINDDYITASKNSDNDEYDADEYDGDFQYGDEDDYNEEEEEEEEEEYNGNNVKYVSDNNLYNAVAMSLPVHGAEKWHEKFHLLQTWDPESSYVGSEYNDTVTGERKIRRFPFIFPGDDDYENNKKNKNKIKHYDILYYHVMKTGGTSLYHMFYNMNDKYFSDGSKTHNNPGKTRSPRNPLRPMKKGKGAPHGIESPGYLKRFVLWRNTASSSGGTFDNEDYDELMRIKSMNLKSSLSKMNKEQRQKRIRQIVQDHVMKKRNKKAIRNIDTPLVEKAASRRRERRNPREANSDRPFQPLEPEQQQPRQHRQRRHRRLLQEENNKNTDNNKLLIISLRNPVERVISHYFQLKPCPDGSGGGNHPKCVAAANAKRTMNIYPYLERCLYASNFQYKYIDGKYENINKFDFILRNDLIEESLVLLSLRYDMSIYDLLYLNEKVNVDSNQLLNNDKDDNYDGDDTKSEDDTSISRRSTRSRTQEGESCTAQWLKLVSSKDNKNSTTTNCTHSCAGLLGTKIFGEKTIQDIKDYNENDMVLWERHVIPWYNYMKRSVLQMYNKTQNDLDVVVKDYTNARNRYQAFVDNF